MFVGSALETLSIHVHELRLIEVSCGGHDGNGGHGGGGSDRHLKFFRLEENPTRTTAVSLSLSLSMSRDQYHYHYHVPHHEVPPLLCTTITMFPHDQVPL